MLPAIATLAGPAILSFILQNAYHINDAWFLGKVGASASNAMGLFMMVSIANFGFILVLARGTQSLVGRRLGGRDAGGAFGALAQGLGMAARIAVPLAAIEWYFAPELLQLMGGEGETVVQGTAYLRTLFLFMPAMFFSPLVEFSLQGLGDTRTPFRLQCVAVCVNFVLNAALVLDQLTIPAGWPGGGTTVPLAGLGVMGAAIATGSSRTVSALLGFLVLVRRDRGRPLVQWPSYRIDRRVAGEILRVGVPAGAATLLYAVVSMGLLKIIGQVGGQDAYGAYGIGFRGVESISFMIVLGLGVGTSTVVSHAVGAGDDARARRAGHVGVGLGVGAMLLTTTIFLSMPARLAGIYTSDAEIISIAVTYIVAMAWCQVPQAFEMIYSEAMAGAGSSMRTAALTIPGNVVRLPLAWFLAVHLELGLWGVWWAVIASAVFKGLAVTALYLSGSWEKAMWKGREALEAA